MVEKGILSRDLHMPELDDIGRSKQKCIDSDSYHACTECHPGICSPLIHSIASNDSVSGQQRP